MTPGRLLRGSIAALTALLLVIGAAPAPLASGPRPTVQLPTSTVADRTVAPAPLVDERFTTLPLSVAYASPGTWVIPRSALPLAMTVEQGVAARYGLESLVSALEVWNDTPGSRFSLRVAGVVDQGVTEKRRDGVNRVFLDERDCGERYLARAHIYPSQVERLDDRSVAWVTEVDIGVCDRLTTERLAGVLRHEVAHVAGLGHLCDAGSACWTPGMTRDNRCRVMNPAAYSCQQPTAGDAFGFAYMYPVLPRVSGRDRTGTAAAVSYLGFPRSRSQDRVLLTAVDAPPELQASAAVLAGLQGVPHLLVDNNCTSGPDGRELNRVAAMGATAVLVGAVATTCEDDLRLGWEFTTERLADTRAVTDAVAAAVGEPARLVLALRPEEDSTAVGYPAVAAPAAVGLAAPLLTTGTDELDGLVSDVLEAFPSIAVVTLVGGTRTDTEGIVRQLVDDHGQRIRHLDATDTVEAARKVSRMRDVFGPDPGRTVLVAADRATDGTAAASLAILTGAAVMTVYTGPASPDVRVGEYLADRVAAGHLVGGRDAISYDLAIRLSRAVDGVLAGDR
jgi:hypothetical protein